MILPEMGPPPGESLKLSQLCRPGSAICDAGWPTPDCPWSMLVCRSQKKYFRNFNFNFNYRELLSKSATFSLRSFGVVFVSKRFSTLFIYLTRSSMSSGTSSNLRKCILLRTLPLPCRATVIRDSPVQLTSKRSSPLGIIRSTPNCKHFLP